MPGSDEKRPKAGSKRPWAALEGPQHSCSRLVPLGGFCLHLIGAFDFWRFFMLLFLHVCQPLPRDKSHMAHTSIPFSIPILTLKGSCGNHITEPSPLPQLASSMISQEHPPQQTAFLAFFTVPLLSPGTALKPCLQKAFPG